MDKTFQSFDDQSDAATCAPRFAALRAELAKRWLDGFLVPRSDEHQGEYVPGRAERLAWLTAFTGSAGAAVVLADKAAIFVDGRYTLQVRQQTDTSLFEPRDLIAEGPAAWIEANAGKGAKLGYDPWLHTAGAVESLKSAAGRRPAAALVPCDTNPIDAVWSISRPAPLAKAKPHAMALAGENARSQAHAPCRGCAQEKGADAAVLTLPDSICWLLNIRGHDVPHTPFALAFAILQWRRFDRPVSWTRANASPDSMQHLGNAVQAARAGRIHPGAGCAVRARR